MLKTYTTPEMIVHGSIEELTEINGPEAFSDLLIFNGDVIAQSDDSQSINCTSQGCVDSVQP
ncbi:MAG: lasso peptide [Moorea sp. SIO2I5]|nr:lasso peptide [Moorena sp. SIO2I5]